MESLHVTVGTVQNGGLGLEVQWALFFLGIAETLSNWPLFISSEIEGMQLIVVQ